MQKIYTAIGLDPAVTRACNFKQRQTQGGAVPGAGASTGPAAFAGSPASPGGGAAGTAAFQGAAGGGGQARARRGLVFTVKAGKYTPKVVRLGISNFDVSEVLSGVNEGDSVAILNVAVLQAQQQNDLQQVRNRAGVPGMQRQPAAGAAGGAGAGGAARPNGGGGAPRGGG
jgi:HlyD family secretion protein